ncbi:rhomboid family protein [Tomitella fengzijianii]|uniref:Rhomboid family intramembrane serine protease n=1 Tax=Tomitella fengzijianii TaxID=2597660 RepID=A0A516X8G0_9ACTN|nr:rhomboid family intramembrane serine protease [Tomitella fengzijianii]QDQ99352.1 rhomboid family intramembrane serine protease [Tomitella fengzijianii]
MPRWKSAGVAAGGFVAVLYIVELLDTIMGGRLDSLGIEPRTVDGLWGIVFAPLLHFGWQHLLANTLPLLVLGYVLALSGVGRAAAATAIVWVIGGAGVWLFGASGTEVAGASVIVFGWLVYLLARGAFTRHWADIVVGVLILVAYGSLLWGVLPSSPHVSWLGHLSGAVGGFVAAWLLGRDPRGAAPAGQGKIRA